MRFDTRLNLINVQIECDEIPCSHMLCENCPLCNDSASMPLKDLIKDWVRLKEMDDKAREIAESIHEIFCNEMEEEKDVH